MQGHGSYSWRRLSRGPISVALTTALLAFAFPGAAGAATITPTIFSDESTNNTTCSLREAVKAANDNADTHEDACNAGDAGIDFISLSAGTYTLAGTSGEDGNASGDLDLVAAGEVNFAGTATAAGVPTTTIDINDADRILDLQPDAGGAVTVRVNEVVLRDGRVLGGAPAGDGGAIRVRDPDTTLEVFGSRILDSDAGHYGGAIHFTGGDATSGVSIEQSEFSGNTADEGGALWLDQDYNGDADVKRSTFTGNSAQEGGAIYLGTRANDAVQLDMVNSTVSGNTASIAGGAFAFDMAESGNLFINFSTIAGNTSTPAGSGGGIMTVDVPPDDQFVYIGQSIVAGNTAGGAPSNCAGDGNYQSAGYNIESTNSCGFSTASPYFDLLNTDPLLAPLATNAGGDLTTRTQGLYDGSPALNRIPTGSCASASGVDQREVVRPVGGSCDVGAFEGSIPRPATGPIVKCGGKTATKVGTNGKNKLVGTNKADVIAGLGGNDTIKGKGGKDILCGGKGKDKLIGGKGRDKLLGQAGRDILRGGPGRDKLKGGPGRDRQIQ